MVLLIAGGDASKQTARPALLPAASVKA